MDGIAAGRLTDWLDELATGDGTDVPCGSCDACCRSGMFVHVEPDEVATLRRIPKALRFPAPGLPPGHVVLPYDQDGRCPMLTDAGCSIYDDRPRTCRRFDCRVFAAAGLAPDEPAIAERVRAWRWDDPTTAEHEQLVAIRRRAAGEPPGHRRPGDIALDAIRAASGQAAFRP